MDMLRHMLALLRAAPRKRWFFRSLLLANRGGDRTVPSADGTPLRVRRMGQGPPVVLVHGTTDGIAAFAFVEPALAEHYTTWVYDRRGRGGSGDAAGYSFGLEVEDLRAVLTAAGHCHVVAHSFGALIALRAAADGARMRSLTLYEPPLMSEHFPHEAARRMRSLIDAGDVDGGLRVMIGEVACVSQEERQIAQSFGPVWKQLLDGARAAPREVEVVRDAGWGDEGFPLTGIPVLAIHGGREETRMYPTADELSRFVSGAENVTLHGQGHLALTMAPYRFAGVVLRFLERH